MKAKCQVKLVFDSNVLPKRHSVLDEEMSLIRDEIQDAQQYFSAFKETATRRYGKRKGKEEQEG